jgi:hypothetical protein
MAACSGPMAGKDSLPELDDGSIRGELVDFVARFDDDTTLTTYFLRVNGNERDQRELVLDKAPNLAPMAKVKVWGVERKGRIVVDRIEPVDPNDNIDTTSTWQQPLINPTPLPATKLAMAVVDVGGGTNITPDELNKRLFTNADSTKAYYLQNSFGMHDLVGMVSPKTYTYAMTTCDTSGMASALRATIDTDVGQVSDVYLWYFGSKVSACAWSGLSGGKDTFYNASSSCVVLVQEPGHSFGMSHSSSMACTDPGSGAVVPILDDLGTGDVATCTHNEYGNRYDTMGGGCRHFNAYNKVYRTYFQKCNGVNVRKSGTFHLMPIEKPCNGIQTLQVPMPHVRGFFRTGGGGSDGVTQLAYYTIELRSPIGFDTGLKPTVIINASPKWSVISTGGTRGSRGEHTWLLDMAPSVTTGTDGTAHALALGQTFTDPGGGVAITTMSVGPDGADIKIDITGATTVPDAGTETVCLDGTPIPAPGPENCGYDGGGAPPPIDDVTPPPIDAGGGGTTDAARPPDVRTDPTTGTGGTGASGGTGGTGGAGTGGTGTGGSGTSGTGGATTGTGGMGGTTTGTGTGAGGNSTGTGGDTTGGSGTRGTGTGPGNTSGCGCRIASSEDGHAAHASRFALFGLALAGLVRRRARRRAV